MKQQKPADIIQKIFGDVKLNNEVRIIKETPYALTLELDRRDISSIISNPDIQSNITKAKVGGFYLAEDSIIIVSRKSLNPMENPQSTEVSHENIHAFNTLIFETDKTQFLTDYHKVEATIRDHIVPLQEARKIINMFSQLLLDKTKDELVAYYSQKDAGLLHLVMKAGEKAAKSKGASEKKGLIELVMPHYIKWAVSFLDSLRSMSLDPEIRALLERKKQTIQKIVGQAVETYDLLYQTASANNSDNSLTKDQISSRRNKLGIAAALTPLHAFHQLAKAGPRLLETEPVDKMAT